MNGLSFRRGDTAVIALILAAAISVAAAFALAAADGGEAVAEIRRDGELGATLPLNADAQYTVEGAYTNTICVEAGEVFFASSDCPGGDCVHSGAISRPGRSLVCLPNRVEVRVVSKTAATDVDAVVG